MREEHAPTEVPGEDASHGEGRITVVYSAIAGLTFMPADEEAERALARIMTDLHSVRLTLTAKDGTVMEFEPNQEPGGRPRNAR